MLLASTRSSSASGRPWSPPPPSSLLGRLRPGLHPRYSRATFSSSDSSPRLAVATAAPPRARAPAHPRPRAPPPRPPPRPAPGRRAAPAAPGRGPRRGPPSPLGRQRGHRRCPSATICASFAGGVCERRRQLCILLLRQLRGLLGELHARPCPPAAGAAARARPFETPDCQEDRRSLNIDLRARHNVHFGLAERLKTATLV